MLRGRTRVETGIELLKLSRRAGIGALVSGSIAVGMLAVAAPASATPPTTIGEIQAFQTIAEPIDSALSADGSTLVVTGDGANGNGYLDVVPTPAAGSAARPTVTSIALSIDPTATAVSADGTTIYVGGLNDETGVGSIEVFSKSASGYAFASSFPVAHPNASTNDFPLLTALALSADGTELYEGLQGEANQSVVGVALNGAAHTVLWTALTATPTALQVLGSTLIVGGADIILNGQSGTIKGEIDAFDTSDATTPPTPLYTAYVPQGAIAGFGLGSDGTTLYVSTLGLSVSRNGTLSAAAGTTGSIIPFFTGTHALGTPIALSGLPIGAPVASPDGSTLYVPLTQQATQQSSVALIDLATSQVTSAIASGFDVTGLVAPTATGANFVVYAIDADGRVAVIGSGVANPAAPAAATLTGSPARAAVGTTISVSAAVTTPAAWTAGTRLSYQWYDSEGAIPGATSAKFAIPGDEYQIDPLWVQVTGVTPGYLDTVLQSAPVAVTPGTLKSARPTVVGVAKVGDRLTARTAGWTGGTGFTYQWYAGSKAISGAKKSTLTLAAAQYAQKISVKVTGSQYGYRTVSNVQSASTRTVAAGILTAPTPKIVGAAKHGHRVSVTTGAWTKGTKLSFQWLQNGHKISKATKPYYYPAASLTGRKLTVEVTGRLTGYTTATKTSKAALIK